MCHWKPSRSFLRESKLIVLFYTLQHVSFTFTFTICKPWKLCFCCVFFLLSLITESRNFFFYIVPLKAIQVFLECNSMVFFIFQILNKSIHFGNQESDVFLHISKVEFVTTWLFPLFSLFTNFSMKNRIEAGDIHSRACMPKHLCIKMYTWIYEYDLKG